jgi:adenine-specific DNA-methyltransferase
MAQLQFKGKTFVQNHHLLVKYHELVPVKAKSLTDKVTLHDNLIIHGDNLRGLKALLPLYAGKVKCVCIDPPYNTGNEGWAYNDNVNSPMLQEWFGKVVDREDLTRHDKWLCMMMPRLKLLRELMTDDGAIFVSIDDNEVHHLRMLMDEVFGEENFIATVIWQKIFSPKNTARHFSEDHDFIVVYARNVETWTPELLERSEAALARYENPDNDPRGPWSSSDLAARNYYGAGTYEVTSPAGKKFKATMGAYWRVSKEKFAELDKDNRIWWGANGSNMPRMKRFLSDVKDGVVPQTLWLHKNVGHTQDAKKELLSLVEFKSSDDVFVTVKPSSLIRKIVSIATDKDSIVLDSFAGSASTAHAVLAKNAEDGGNRRFILIECEDYADKITAERVRRVIKGVPTAKDDALKQGLGGTFSFFKIGKAIELESILDGKALPTYEDLARYVFYTATGEEFDPKAVDRKKLFVGESRNYQVFLLYEPDVAKLKNMALTLDIAKALPKLKNGKRRLVFAPTKYLDQDHLDQFRIDFAQLPFEIYELTR